MLKHGWLAFTRGKWALVTVTLVPDIFPFGLAVYSIGLKSLTTPTTRPIAFALSTVLLNLGIFGGLSLVDVTRKVPLRERAREQLAACKCTARTTVRRSLLLVRCPAAHSQPVPPKAPTRDTHRSI